MSQQLFGFSYKKSKFVYLILHKHKKLINVFAVFSIFSKNKVVV